MTANRKRALDAAAALREALADRDIDVVPEVQLKPDWRTGMFGPSDERQIALVLPLDVAERLAEALREKP